MSDATTARWTAMRQEQLRRRLAETSDRAERKAIKDAIYRVADLRERLA